MDEKKEVSVRNEAFASLGRALFGAIPYVGPAINEVLFENRSRLKQARINRFVEELKNEMGMINEQSINYEYLKSDEFSDILESILARIVNNRSEEKLHRFKKVLIKQMTEPFDSDFTETFLDIITRINEQQIQIIGYFKEIDQVKEDSIKESIAKLLGISNDLYRFYLQDLISKGLLIDDSVNRLNTRPLGIVNITKFGLEFLNFIESK